MSAKKSPVILFVCCCFTIDQELRAPNVSKEEVSNGTDGEKVPKEDGEGVFVMQQDPGEHASEREVPPLVKRQTSLRALPSWMSPTQVDFLSWLAEKFVWLCFCCLQAFHVI